MSEHPRIGARVRLVARAGQSVWGRQFVGVVGIIYDRAFRDRSDFFRFRPDRGQQCRLLRWVVHRDECEVLPVASVSSNMRTEG